MTCFVQLKGKFLEIARVSSVTAIFKCGIPRGNNESFMAIEKIPEIFKMEKTPLFGICPCLLKILSLTQADDTFCEKCGSSVFSPNVSANTEIQPKFRR